MSSRALRELILQVLHGSLVSDHAVSSSNNNQYMAEPIAANSGACCGRPFLDGNVMLGAAPCARTDWLGTPLHLETALPTTMRNAIGRAWLRDARLEHASIASFAKFTLQLLSLGAPDRPEAPRPYPAGSWGPTAAIALIERDGRTWHEELR